MSTPSRRLDGQPETEADTRFFDERDAGYTGPLDQDGRRALTSPQVEILEHLGRINQHERGQR